MPSHSFKEDFLQYIWQYQFFSKTNLLSTTGDRIEILSPGFLNGHSGPDFYNARLVVQEIEWHGTVEIHYKTSDWIKHNHSSDKAYNNVILHVVWEQDVEPVRQDGTTIPTLELKNKIDNALITKYKNLISNDSNIPCSNLISTIDPLYVTSMLEKTILERIENKAKEILTILDKNNTNWEETIYQWLGKCFGFKINSDPFFQLCQLLPYSVVKKYQTKSKETEALLFGVAGFLSNHYEDDYYKTLQKEFTYLASKHSIKTTIDASEWKFLRLRPANFPTIRLAQFAAFLNSVPSLSDFVLVNHTWNDCFNSKPNEYWQTHYHFKSESSSKQSVRLGKQSIENLILNAIVPLRFAHAWYLNDEEEMEHSLEILKSLKPETNSITDKYLAFGLQKSTGYESQALVQLHNNYCVNKKCLHCSIGSQLIYPENKTVANG